jgi:hypothetical protein
VLEFTAPVITAPTRHRGRPAGDTGFGWVSLRPDEGDDLFSPVQVRDFSGVLAPGRYTFSGYTGAWLPPLPVRGVSTNTIGDIRLTVVPEPAGVLAAAALVLCLGGRPRTRA